MAGDPTIILQTRAHRAAAQVSLHRLLASRALDEVAPHVVLGEPGWLADALELAGIPCSVVPFPKSRSVAGRLGKNRGFARTVIERVGRPSRVVANEHHEALLARSVARAAECPRAVFLRSFGVTERDLRKNACQEASAVFAVGAQLRGLAEEWLKRPVEDYPEGLLESDFHPPKPAAARFPERVLLVGSPQARKGWTDFVSALSRVVARQPRFPAVQWCFTAGSGTNLGTPPPRQRFDFIGRSTDYSALVRQHDLVVHPSRGETFGLAVVEAWAAGVPVLASDTGVVPDLDPPHALRFPPKDVEALADRLDALTRAWPDFTAAPAEIQTRLRQRHLMPDCAAPMTRALCELR